jgi:hypothetical protein
LAETPLGVQDFNQGKELVTSLPIIGVVGGDIAARGETSPRGITIRKTIDLLIATNCIEKGLVWFTVRCSSLGSSFAEFSASLPFTSRILSDTLRGWQLAVNKEQGGDWMASKYKSGHSETIVLEH